MTEKLYYQDPKSCDFKARVTGIESDKRGYKVYLDKTCFYPEGGGQAADRGTLDGKPVLDVQKEGDEIAHYLKSKPENDIIDAHVDWNYRLDYMQQHSGQHVLSACLLKIGGYNTKSVHQGEDYTSIEVDAEDIDKEKLKQIEDEANKVICRNIPIETVWITDAEIDKYFLRREPKVSGDIRIVRIPEVDTVACGGIHCGSTGEIGLVHAMGSETIRGRKRIYWKIGGRAYRDYREKSKIVADLIDLFSAKPEEITDRATSLTEQVKDLKYRIKQLREGLAEREAELAVSRSTKHLQTKNDGKVPYIQEKYRDWDKELFKQIGLSLSEKKAAACLVNETGEQFHWCIVVPDNRDFPFNEKRSWLLEPIQAKGGGKAPIWQGIGTKRGDLEDFFSRVSSALESELT